jgi:hypothetical protein
LSVQNIPEPYDNRIKLVKPPEEAEPYTQNITKLKKTTHYGNESPPEVPYYVPGMNSAIQLPLKFNEDYVEVNANPRGQTSYVAYHEPETSQKNRAKSG